MLACYHVAQSSCSETQRAKRIATSLSLLALLATILLGGSAFGAIPLDRQEYGPPDGVRRMLRVLEAPERAEVQDGRHVVAQIRLKPRRCDYSGADLSAAHAMLRAAGFRSIRYLGSTQISTICTKYVHVTACRGRLRHRVDVQFMRHYGRNDGIAGVTRQGFCLPPRRVPGLPTRRLMGPGS